MDDAELRAWYGGWEPLRPAEVRTLLAGSGVRWYVAGGRAARLGAPRRDHEDTDVVVPRSSVPALRQHLTDWHLWEAHDGALRPLLDTLPDRVEQLWLRRDAGQPWRLDVLLQPDAPEWVFTKDDRVRLPWDRALVTVDGIDYLRPELALLHKAHLDRPKDRADRAAAVLDAEARGWLAGSLALLGQAAGSGSVRDG